MKLSKQTSAQFLADVTLMTDDQAGRYFKLVCFLTQKDILRKAEFDAICGGDEVVASMFEDEGGYYKLRETSKKKGRRVPQTVEEAEKELKELILPFVAEYGRDMCNEFYRYWKEKTKDGKQNNYMLKKTWDTKRRLDDWRKNNRNNNNRGIPEQNQPTTTSVSFK